jgi:hypothetical protein
MTEQDLNLDFFGLEVQAFSIMPGCLKRETTCSEAQNYLAAQSGL